MLNSIVIAVAGVVLIVSLIPKKPCTSFTNFWVICICVQEHNSTMPSSFSNRYKSLTTWYQESFKTVDRQVSYFAPYRCIISKVVKS